MSKTSPAESRWDTFERIDFEIFPALKKYFEGGGTMGGLISVATRAMKEVSPAPSGATRGAAGPLAPAIQNKDAGRAISIWQDALSERYRRAASSVAKVVALTVLDTYKIRDGRAIGDVRYGELESLRSSNVMEAAIIRQIQKYAQAAHDAKVRDIITADDLNRFKQKAAEIADAS